MNYLNQFPVKKIFKSIIFYTFVICIAHFDAKSQSYTGGGFAESYISRNIGSRVSSMAGAYTAVANDPSAIFVNPAGLGFVSNTPTLFSSVSSLDNGITLSSLAWSQTVNENFGVGIGLVALNSPTFVSRNVKGQVIGDLTSSQYTFGISCAYKKDFMSIGATGKILKNVLSGSGFYATGYALDLGTKFNVLDLFSFGLAVQNINGTMIWNTKTLKDELIPFTLRTGIAMEFGFNSEKYTNRSEKTGNLETYYVPATKYMIVSLDAVQNQYERSPYIVLGTEIVAHEMIAFRGGISVYGENENTPQLLPLNRWGAGFSIRPELEELPFKTNIDYTVSNEYLSKSGISHNISIIFEF